MSIHWEKVLTDPLGLAGYALFLVFGIVTLVVKQKKPNHSWIAPAGFALAAICVLGGLSLAYLRQPAPPAPVPVVTAPAPSMKIDKVDQKVDCGNAVAGVQGTVTNTSDCGPEDKKVKP